MVKKKEQLQILDNEEHIDIVLSYSKISDFDRNGANSLVRKQSINNNGIKLGSIVDDLLFLDKEKFNEIYYRYNGDKPTAMLGTLCDIITNHFVEIPTKEMVLDTIKLNNLWKRQKDETLISNFDIPEFWNYLTCIFESKNKIIITDKDYDNATELISILRTHDFSKHILDNNNDNYYQVRFEYEYNKFKIRGIIDILTIDHDNKTVTMTDLKTGKNSSNEFEESFIKWRYYFQGALYIKAFDEICKELNLEGYTLNPFQFLYISLADKTPLIFKMTDKWVNAAYEGFYIKDKSYRGINELLEEIYWCWKNKEYNISKKLYDNKGVINIKDDFIDINE